MTQPAVQALQACLQAESQAVQRFTALLEAEAEALTERASFDNLPALTEGKNQLAQELSDLAEQRNGILASLGLPGDHAGTDAAVSQHPVLQSAWQTLQANVADARHLNLRNGTLIETHARHVQHSLDSLRSATGLGNLYDAQGRSHKVGAGKSIAAG